MLFSCQLFTSIVLKPSRSALNLDAVCENTLVWFIVSELCSAMVAPPPNSTQEDLAPLLSPRLSIAGFFHQRCC